MSKEREALVLLLDNWDTEDVEKKYIFEALELLSTRENLLINEKSVSFYKTYCYFHITFLILFY